MKNIIEANFEDFMSDLQRLVSIESVYAKDDSPYPFGEKIDMALREMLAIAEKMGFKTYYDPQGYYGYADYGSGETMMVYFEDQGENFRSVFLEGEAAVVFTGEV